MFGRKSFADMHAWVEERLSDYIDNQLPSSERAQLDKHLGECSQCRASLESMKWTVVLLKRVPAIASTRSFVLPVPVKRASALPFALASFAAAAATLLLFALIGIDLITRLGTASAPAAPNIALQKAQPTIAAASAPQLPPTSAPAPTAVPKAMSAAPASSSSSAASSSAASSSAASMAPAPAGAPTSGPPMVDQTAVAESATNAARDGILKSPEATPVPRQALTGSATTGTATPSPTWTATPTRTPTPVPPTATIAPTSTVTPVPPTATPQPTRVALVPNETSRASGAQPSTLSEPFFSPLRLAEIGALFGAVFFGVLVFLLRRR